MCGGRESVDRRHVTLSGTRVMIDLQSEVGAVAEYYDLVFVGNVGRNEMHRFDGSTGALVGGPVFQSAVATAWSDKRIAVVTRMAEGDADLLEPLRDAGIEIFISPAAETTRHHVYHLSHDVDERRFVLEKTAGSFSLADLPPIEARLFHLVGLNRIEFPIEFIRGLRGRGLAFAVDTQALVRVPDPKTGEVAFGDYPHKKEVAAMAEKIKLDVVEGEILTGTADQEQAAIQFEKWGAPEVMVTRAAGALVRFQGTSYFEPFTNRNVSGRTGRGDTVFGAYLARRLDHGVADSLKFAVALASIKMETPGPFTGTLQQVLDRMSADH
jgi:sugar/nucleoside kinase (ribokinase family)